MKYTGRRSSRECQFFWGPAQATKKKNDQRAKKKKDDHANFLLFCVDQARPIRDDAMTGRMNGGKDASKVQRLRLGGSGAANELCRATRLDSAFVLIWLALLVL